jgi:hypothetical protein
VSQGPPYFTFEQSDGSIKASAAEWSEKQQSCDIVKRYCRRPSAVVNLNCVTNRVVQGPTGNGLDEISEQRLQRRVQKLARAARVSFAECSLLQDLNRFLSKINGEARARRSTRSVVLGKVKVMSYEDLEEVRTKLAAKDEAAAVKMQSRCKRKGASLKSGATEPKTKAARATKEPAEWRAPVARMVAEKWL